MTVYGISPVGAHGAEWHRAKRIEVRSYTELVAENERLRQAWRAAHDARILSDSRANRAARVLAALGAQSVPMAAAVERARREIWRLDR